MTPYFLLFLGLVFVFIEFYVPGTVMGIIGGLFISASIFVFAAQAETIWAVLLYLVGIGIALGYLIKFALWRIRTAPANRSVYSADSQEGYVASTFDKSAIGKSGVVMSDLKPGGYVLIDGKQHQALSESEYISKGSLVQAIGGQEESLIVKQVSKSS